MGNCDPEQKKVQDTKKALVAADANLDKARARVAAADAAIAAVKAAMAVCRVLNPGPLGAVTCAVAGGAALYNAQIEKHAAEQERDYDKRKVDQAMRDWDQAERALRHCQASAGAH